MYALDADTGALRWKSFVGAEVYFAPAVGGGRVYAASYDEQRLAAFDAETGEELWSISRTGDSFAAMPSYDAEQLYVATNNFDTGAGSVLALDAATGELLWEAEGHGDAAVTRRSRSVSSSSPARARTTGSSPTTGRRGERAWVHPVGAAVSNSQLAADGVIVGGSQQDHRVWALDAYSGELLWEDTLSDNILSAPALADGRLVVADRSGVVRAYEAPGTIAGRSRRVRRPARRRAARAGDRRVRCAPTRRPGRSSCHTGLARTPSRPTRTASSSARRS